MFPETGGTHETGEPGGVPGAEAEGVGLLEGR